MKTKALSFALVIMSLLIYSCDVIDEHVIPDNRVTTQQVTLSNYDMIDASHAFSVYVTFSDTEESIEIEANDNLHQYIEVKKENNVLKIGLQRNVNIRGSATLNAYITTKPISGFAGSGATRFILEDVVDGDEASIFLSGASIFNGELLVDRLYADLSGASVANINGSSDQFDLEASGASLVRDYGFNTKLLRAELSGASNMYVSVDEEIDIEASGASSLYYKGQAVIVRQDLSGASSVKKME